jgi:hypothetical protein
MNERHYYFDTRTPRAGLNVLLAASGTRDVVSTLALNQTKFLSSPKAQGPRFSEYGTQPPTTMCINYYDNI